MIILPYRHPNFSSYYLIIIQLCHHPTLSSSNLIIINLLISSYIVLISCMEALGRPLPENHDGTFCIGRLQPDLVLVSQSLRKIAIVVVSRPMDGSSEQLEAAYERRMRTYAPASVCRRRVASGSSYEWWSADFSTGLRSIVVSNSSKYLGSAGIGSLRTRPRSR